MSTPRLKTHTLGCKVNQYETELVREALTKFGYQDAKSRESADLCVINTCTVTSEADAKSRQVIRRMARDNPMNPTLSFDDAISSGSGFNLLNLAYLRERVINNQ